MNFIERIEDSLGTPRENKERTPKEEDKGSQSGEEENPKSMSRISNSNRPNRWSKAHDRALFLTLQDLTKEYGLTLQEFAKIEKRLPPLKKQILEKLTELHNWRGDIYWLRNRIQKRLLEVSFTAREQRVLKRLLKDEVQGSIPLEQIVAHFPGKTLQQVLFFKEKYFNSIKSL